MRRMSSRLRTMDMQVRTCDICEGSPGAQSRNYASSAADAGHMVTWSHGQGHLAVLSPGYKKDEMSRDILGVDLDTYTLLVG